MLKIWHDMCNPLVNVRVRRWCNCELRPAQGLGSNVHSVNDVVYSLHKFNIVGNPLDQDFRQLDMAIIIKEAPCAVGLAVGNVVVLCLSAQVWIFDEISLMHNSVTFRLFDVKRLCTTCRKVTVEYGPQVSIVE